MSLHNDIVKFLKSLPTIHDKAERLALIYSASLDKEIENQIVFEGTSDQFCQLLVHTLARYGMLKDGRHALESLLEAANSKVGQEGKAECNRLIQALKRDGQKAIGLSTEFSENFVEARYLHHTFLNVEEYREIQRLFVNIDVFEEKRTKSEGIKGSWEKAGKPPTNFAYGSPFLVDKYRQKISISQVKSDYNRVLLLGEAGAGKSTILKYIAYTSAERIIRKDETILPVFIALKLYASNYNIETLIATKLGDLSWKALTNKYKILLLLDGFNEIDLTERKNALREISLLSHDLSLENVQIVVTSRYDNYNASFVEMGFEKLEIATLSFEKQKEFIHNYLGNELRLAQKATSLVENLPNLFSNPFILSATMALVSYGDDLPLSQFLVIDHLCDRIFQREQNQDKNQTCSPTVKQHLLARLAYEMIAHDIKTGIEQSLASSIIGDELRMLINKGLIGRNESAGANNIIEELIDNGILVREQRKISFYHPKIQEYYAGRYLWLLDLHEEKKGEKFVISIIDEYTAKNELLVEVCKNYFGVWSHEDIKNSDRILNTILKRNQDLYYGALRFSAELIAMGINILSDTQQKVIENLLKIWWEKAGEGPYFICEIIENALLKIRSDEFYEYFLQKSLKGATHKRAHAIYMLGEFRREESLEPLIELLKSKSEEIPDAAAEAIGKIGTTEAISALIDNLDGPVSRVVDLPATLRPFHSIERSIGVPLLLKAIKEHPSDVVAEWASFILYHYYQEKDNSVDVFKDVSKLLKTVHPNRIPYLLKNLAASKTEESYKLLLNYRDYDQLDVKLAFVEAIQEYFSSQDDALKIFIDLLSDENLSVKREVNKKLMDLKLDKANSLRILQKIHEEGLHYWNMLVLQAVDTSVYDEFIFKILHKKEPFDISSFENSEEFLKQMVEYIYFCIESWARQGIFYLLHQYFPLDEDIHFTDEEWESIRTNILEKISSEGLESIITDILKKFSSILATGVQMETRVSIIRSLADENKKTVGELLEKIFYDELKDFKSAAHEFFEGLINSEFEKEGQKVDDILKKMKEDYYPDYDKINAIVLNLWNNKGPQSLEDIIKNLLTKYHIKFAFEAESTVIKEIFHAIANNGYAEFFAKTVNLFSNENSSSSKNENSYTSWSLIKSLLFGSSDVEREFMRSFLLTELYFLNCLKEEFVGSLAKIQNETSTNLLEGFLYDEDIDAKRQAIVGIARQKLHKYRDELLDIALHNKKLRYTCEPALEYMGFENIPFVIIHALEEKDIQRYESIIKNVKTREDLFKLALSAAKDREPYIRSVGIGMLKDFDSHEIVDILKQALNDDEKIVRDTAFESLYTWQLNKAQGVENIKEPSKDWPFSFEVIRRIRRLDWIERELPQLVIFIFCFYTQLLIHPNGQEMTVQKNESQTKSKLYAFWDFVKSFSRDLLVKK